MEIPQVGKILEGDVQRDAIHIATQPVVANEDLKPGQHIGVVAGLNVGPTNRNIGIVDPYITAKVIKKGQRFLLFLYPGSITDLRHHWSHPELDKGQEDFMKFLRHGPAIAYIQRVAEQFAYALTYDEFIEEAKNYAQGGEHYNDVSERYKQIDTDWDEFWKHFKSVYGFAPRYSGGFFTCSCG